MKTLPARERILAENDSAAASAAREKKPRRRRRALLQRAHTHPLQSACLSSSTSPPKRWRRASSFYHEMEMGLTMNTMNTFDMLRDLDTITRAATRVLCIAWFPEFRKVKHNRKSTTHARQNPSLSF